MLHITDTTYLVDDLDEALDWFTGSLGFAVREDETNDSGKRRVVVGADEGPGLVFSVAPRDVVRAQSGGKVAFFLRTDDFAAEHARLTAAGVRFREEPRHEPWGTVAIFDDLHGIGWDLIEPPTDA